MADNLKDRGPADRARINVHEEYELTYWTKKFNVSAERLKKVVQEVGPMAADVERKLTNQPDKK